MGVTARQIVPVAVLLTALIGLFVAAESGQQRLAEASRRVEIAALRHRVLSDTLQLVTQAESGQRGYLLVGTSTYLLPYDQSVQRMGAALHRLDEVFLTATPAERAEIDTIQRLVKLRMQVLADSLTLYRQGGQKAALELMRTDLGVHTMTELADSVRQLEYQQTTDLVATSRSWRDDLWVTRLITAGGLILNVFLVLIVRRLVMRDMRSREREAQSLTERGAELERVVRERTEDLSALSTHLQTLAEQEKSSLSRELHDELGGLLVAARMDVSWLEEHLSSTDPDLKSHFKRLHDALQAGVDVKRRVIESLRPTLLDNLGLFPALRWQLAESCGRAGLNYTERYPELEPTLTADASIAIFRVVQESMTNIIKHASARNVEVSVDIEGEWLVVRIRDDGVGVPPERLKAIGSHGLAAMRHRAAAFGGRWHISRRQPRGTEISVSLPLARIGTAGGASEPSSECFGGVRLGEPAQ